MAVAKDQVDQVLRVLRDEMFNAVYPHYADKDLGDARAILQRYPDHRLWITLNRLVKTEAYRTNSSFRATISRLLERLDEIGEKGG